jgi:hypothetical protein
VFGEVVSGEELLEEMANLPFVTGRSLDPSGQSSPYRIYIIASQTEGVSGSVTPLISYRHHIVSII